MNTTKKNHRVAKVLLLAVAASTALLLSGCLPGDGTSSAGDPAGFLWGVWHGWVAPVSLIIGLFDRSIHVYESANTGWWYDFGFYIAVVGGFGGLTLFRRKKTVIRTVREDRSRI